MTEKRFIVIDAPYENGEPFLYKKMLDKTTKKEYNNTLKGIDDICDLANKLHKENEELKEEKEKWKSNCSLAISENSILWNEINILREQGAEPSEAFNDYLNKKRGDLNDCETILYG